MLSILRIIRAYGKRESGQRIQALRQEAAAQPQGTASYVLAVVLWEEGEIDEANHLAEAFLEESPADFNMLVICLDYQIRANNPSAISEYAHRVAAVRKPSTFRQVASVLARPRTWPARLFGRGQSTPNITEALDEWAQWAQDYVDQKSPATVGPNKSLERTREG
jgi:hypothetical protein